MSGEKGEKEAESTTLRTTELALLTAAAVTLILSQDTEARARLHAAQTELLRWPDVADIRKAFPADVVGIDDLPKRLTPGWVEERLNHVSGPLRVNVYQFRADHACLELGQVACVTDLQRLPPRTDWPEDQLQLPRGCKPGNWEVRAIVAPVAPAGIYQTAVQTLGTCRKSALELSGATSARDAAQAQLARLIDAVTDKGGGVGDGKRKAGSAQQQLDNVTRAWSDAATALRDARHELLLRSEEAKAAELSSEGRSLLLRRIDGGGASYVLRDVPADDKEPCIGKQTLVFNLPKTPGAPITLAVDTDSGPEACEEGQCWTVTPLITSGAWKDIHDASKTMALATIEDKITETELEGRGVRAQAPLPRCLALAVVGDAAAQCLFDLLAQAAAAGQGLVRERFVPSSRFGRRLLGGGVLNPCPLAADRVPDPDGRDSWRRGRHCCRIVGATKAVADSGAGGPTTRHSGTQCFGA